MQEPTQQQTSYLHKCALLMAAGGSATEHNTQDYKGLVALGRSLLTRRGLRHEAQPRTMPSADATPSTNQRLLRRGLYNTCLVPGEGRERQPGCLALMRHRQYQEALGVRPGGPKSRGSGRTAGVLQAHAPSRESTWTPRAHTPGLAMLIEPQVATVSSSASRQSLTQ